MSKNEQPPREYQGTADKVITLRLVEIDRGGRAHFADDTGSGWRSAKAEYGASHCWWCGATSAPHADVLLTPQAEPRGIMFEVCVRHFLIDRLDGQGSIPAADWFAQQPHKQASLDYDGTAATVKTWADLDAWVYDIEERIIRLEALDEDLRQRDKMGMATREEIGGWVAARRAVHRQYIRAYGIRKFTMDYVLSKYRNEHETQGEVAAREGWPDGMPPLVFPPEGWTPDLNDADEAASDEDEGDDDDDDAS